jgi:hypothetical protein
MMKMDFMGEDRVVLGKLGYSKVSFYDLGKVHTPQYF